MKRLAIMGFLISVIVIVGGIRGACAQDAADAKVQALKVYETIQKQDWKTLFYLIKFSPSVEKEIGTDPDAWSAGVKKGIETSSDGGKALNQVCAGLSKLAVDEPKITGDTVEVPTSATLTLNGTVFSFKGAVHMIKDGKTWKLDFSGSTDLEAASSKMMADLIGKPQ